MEFLYDLAIFGPFGVPGGACGRSPGGHHSRRNAGGQGGGGGDEGARLVSASHGFV